MRIKPYLLATVSTLVLPGVAFAAEAPSSWTGLYVGLNGGLAWNESSGHVHDAAAPPDHTSASVDISGGTAGVQAGYNWQLGKYLAGIEADWNWADVSGSHGLANNPPFQFTSKLSSLATVRGRFGIACPDTLFYLTGGLAIGRVDNKIPPGSYDLFGGYPPDNATKTGWIAGGGIEHMMAPHWSVKAEALYADLGTSTVQGYIGSGYAFSTHNEAVIARVGVNYRF